MLYSTFLFFRKTAKLFFDLKKCLGVNLYIKFEFSRKPSTADAVPLLGCLGEQHCVAMRPALRREAVCGRAMLAPTKNGCQIVSALNWNLTAGNKTLSQALRA